MALLLGVALPAGLASARTDTAPDAAPPPAFSTVVGVDLPHTDGFGLLPKPPAFSQEDSDRLFAEGKRTCDGPCVTPFGTVLGVADGAEGRSNCVSTCIRPEYSFLDRTSGAVSVHADDPKQENLRYIGVTYQCVEYARKWWM
ncbi:MAG TPA: amidase, partial [Candidatus Paceibacterota bacterium]|nr:amidase [Candidatus Paceibacterota bacterium]